MDVLTFIAAMTGHMMWPLVIIVLLILLRRHLGVLADRIEEFSFGGAKFTWRKKLAEGALIIDHEPKPELTAPPAQSERPKEEPALTPDKKRERIAENFARQRAAKKELIDRTAFGQVLSGLDDVDKELFEIADAMGFDPASASSVMYTLLQHGNVPPSIGNLYNTLRDARNLIAHSATLPADAEADEYLRQTHYLLGVLRNLKQMMPTRAEREKFQ
jgi:hypothetical protein